MSHISAAPGTVLTSDSGKDLPARVPSEPLALPSAQSGAAASCRVTRPAALPHKGNPQCLYWTP